MENIILAAVLLVIVGLAAWYVIRAKKSGKKCIGCPDGGCSQQENGGCGGCSGNCSSNCSGCGGKG